MKKTITILSMALIVAACHRKTAASADTAAAEKLRTEAAAHAEMVTQGKTVYINRCGRCHGLKDATAFTAEEWDGILKIMVPKAKLNETETQQVTAYVKAQAKK